MKKVFLSLAFVAALTVVSCKQADAPAEGTADTTQVETPAVDTAAVDTAAVDTAAVDTTAKK
jgi:PBP1b-binding outer membrane lipoprotein LpoB